MGKMPILLKKGWSFFACVAIAGLILSGCATVSGNQAAREKATVPVIQSVEVRPSAERVVVEIISSEPAPYTAFKLLDPTRIVLDVRGELAEALSRQKDVYLGGVTDIRLEEGKTQAMSSRAVIGTNRPVSFDVKASEKVITVTITPEKEVPLAPETAQVPPAAEEKKPVVPSEPRIFFKDRPGDLAQILGLDFTMLEQGKSRLIVTTDKKVRYDLNQKGAKSLLLSMPQATIPPLIMRHMDSKYFEGAVEMVKASLSAEGVSIAISLREMVPFHVKQLETGLTIDFGPTSVKPPEKKIVPLKQAQAPAASGAPAPFSQAGAPAVAIPPTVAPMQMPSKPEAPGIIGIEALAPTIPGGKKHYTGAAMTMDFVNADVTNILRLIAEVSNLNIVWGPEVRGTVSMRLKDVPWDQALDLVLDNNNLGMRRQGNVIWVTTRAQMAQLEAEERRKIQEYEARLEAERKKILSEKEKEKELEPLVTEYIPVDFAKASEIIPLLSLSETGKSRGGKLSVDARTNMIIMADIVSNVKNARETVKIFDTPVKQVMIEARIVDATDNFLRDLGVRWDNFQIQKRNSIGVPFTNFDALGTTPGNPAAFPPSGRLKSPIFTSNSPDGWRPNLGLVFSKLSASQLTATVLDAKLALSEAEGKTKIISAPKVIAMNGQAATISRGDSIIIPATENVASTTLDATLSLEVTPTVSYNNYVSLDVKVTDDNAPTNTRINKKSINTKLMVKSGDTIVIGGIYTENDVMNEEGIPGLRRVPLMGWLFKARDTTFRKTELLIFLTPTVLPTYTKS